MFTTRHHLDIIIMKPQQQGSHTLHAINAKKECTNLDPAPPSSQLTTKAELNGSLWNAGAVKGGRESSGSPKMALKVHILSPCYLLIPCRLASRERKRTLSGSLLVADVVG